MASKRVISTLVIAGVLAASVSTTAIAGDRRGHSNGAVIAAGIIGGLVIGSIVANAQSAPAPQPQYHQAPQPQPYYQAPPQAYYRQQPVQQVYYGAPPRYYTPQVAVTVSGGDYHGRQEQRQHRQHRQYQYRDYPGHYSR